MKVAFAGAFACRLAGQVRARVQVPCDFILADESAIATMLSDVDVLVTLGFTREMGEAAKRLKLVQVPGAGLDRIDRSALPPGAGLANAYGHEIGIAEYVMGAMLALSRGFGRLDAALREGRWESSWAVGAFDMKICAIRRDPARSGSEAREGLDFLGGPERLDEVLKRADYLAVTLTLTADTRGLLGARELGLMKPTACLINVARAEIADEAALYQALSRRAIAGAALDVWYRYPTTAAPTLPASQPFHTLPNVLMTPHMSGWTEGMMEARVKVVAENIQRIAQGESPANLIP